jgi:D-alanyl-D-alanine carboxypeptidase (penicillin-binding protein 5/6)
MHYNKTLFFLFIGLFSAATLDAKPHKSTKNLSHKNSSQKPVETNQDLSNQVDPKYGIPIKAPYALLIDYDTNEVLLEKNADALMTPSSMTKILTAYMVMKKLKDGAVKEDTEFVVSKNAFRVEGSTSFLNIDDRVKVIDLLKGLIIQSGNDAAVVLAEGIAGSEAGFSNELNQLAKSLGANNTHFVNASGLPHPDHKTTARDLSIIGKRTIQDFPNYYPLWGMTEYAYAGTRQMNRNPLLYKNVGCDGIKTGSSDDGGYGIVASCLREGRRLILVINGLKNMQARADEAMSLMNWGFCIFDNYKILSKGKVIDKIPVWLGHINYVDIVVPNDITLTTKRIDPSHIKYTLDYEKSVSGPRECGFQIGKVTVTIQSLNLTREYPLVLAEEIRPVGLLSRLYDYVVKLFGGRQYKPLPPVTQG